MKGVFFERLYQIFIAVTHCEYWLVSYVVCTCVVLASARPFSFVLVGELWSCVLDWIWI